MTTLYQLCTTQSKILSALEQLKTTWRSDDELLLLNADNYLVANVEEFFRKNKLNGKIFLLPIHSQIKLSVVNATVIDNLSWLTISQTADKVITLNFS